MRGARRALESKYGLALDAVTDQEIGRAVQNAAGSDEPDWESPVFLGQLVDQLPIDESSLFRNEGLWRWLAQVLPGWLDAATARGRPLRVLSIGCSAGQEVFSFAMLIISELRRRGIPATAAPRFANVRGVDASAARIAVASSGLIASWSALRADASWTEGQLHADRPGATHLRVDATVLALTSFATQNVVELVDNANELAGVSVVLCQHVLVYFREETAVEILRRLARSLAPETVLLVSPVEAHLLTLVAELEPLMHVGAARRRTSAEVELALRTKTAPRPVRKPAPRPAPARAVVRAEPVSLEPVAEVYVRAALEHAGAGRADEALAAARAAWFAEPSHLVARLLVGQFLLPVDAPQARRVLQELARDVARLPPTATLPSAVELSVQQLGAAVQLLLEGAS